MNTSAANILLVEKFEPFRNLIRAILDPNPNLRIIAEVGDGFAAVHQAADLKPDLILLDLRLPSLAALDAARLLRTAAPNSKLIFTSQYFPFDLTDDILCTGASGLVLKTRAAADLLPAIEAALQGQLFMSHPPAPHRNHSPKLI